MRLILILVLALGACTPLSNVPKGRDGSYATAPMPAYPRFGQALPAGTTAYSNDSLADLFVQLTHGLEWGARRPNLIRYERPVVVGLSGPGSAAYAGFLDRYLAQLRGNAGLDIARRAGAQNLFIRFVPGNAFRRRVPSHACVVAPGAVRWADFRSGPGRYGSGAFERQRALTAMTVFIPDNAEPYLIRICLIEEIAQALGPANDLYGLGSSIFNDDGAHVWPTRLDYLMLRVLYAPELRTGMDRATTRRRALLALNRLNPAGRRAPPLPNAARPAPAGWAKAIRAAFDRTDTRTDRVAAARRAVSLAQRRAPNSAYHCRALSALLRIADARSAGIEGATKTAARVCSAAHGSGDIRLAQLKLDQARLLYLAGSPQGALATLRGLERAFADHGQEERLSALYALQAAALRAIQQGKRSFEARRRAAEWGAYALGRDHPDVRRWQIR